MKARGPVLELGCGTGRLSIPIARAGVALVGVDRSSPMLARAQRKARSLRSRRDGRRRGRLRLVRGDIRALPFSGRRFSLVLAPYGVLQSLIRPRDLSAALASVARVIAPGDSSTVALADSTEDAQFAPKAVVPPPKRSGAEAA